MAVGRPRLEASWSTTGKELKALVNDGDLPLRPKDAFGVVLERHGLRGRVSGSSFKRFTLAHRIALGGPTTTCRIEVKPRKEIQIDDCRIGLWYDQLSERRRVMYGFIGMLPRAGRPRPLPPGCLHDIAQRHGSHQHPRDAGPSGQGMPKKDTSTTTGTHHGACSPWPSSLV